MPCFVAVPCQLAAVHDVRLLQHPAHRAVLLEVDEAEAARAPVRAHLHCARRHLKGGSVRV